MSFLSDAARLILESEAPVVSVREWLSRHMAATLSLPRTDAAERAIRDLPRFTRLIGMHMDQARARGVPIIYTWSTAVEGDLERVGAFTQEGERLERIAGDRAAIQHCLLVLDPFLFEHVGGFLLRLYGVKPERLEVTQRSNDGGFDFYAVEDQDLVSPYLEMPNRLRRVRYRLVGQAKRFTTSLVDHDELDAFAWRLAMIRAGVGRRYDVLKPWFVDEALPIAGVYVTTSGFTNAAVATAVASHTILLNGEQISHDLAASGWADEWRDLNSGQIDCSAFSRFFEQLRARRETLAVS